MSVSLRPYVPADARRCADIFRSSIEELAADDYSPTSARPGRRAPTTKAPSPPGSPAR